MRVRSPADLPARISQFEASVTRLESSRLAFAARRPVYLRSFTALTLAGFACFAFGGFVGIWGSISASFVALAGYGMVRLRDSELRTEIRTLHREIRHMRAQSAHVAPTRR